MSTVTINLDEDLAILLSQPNQTIEHAALEMIVLEFYRRGAISSGKAGELLRVPRLEFIRYASQLGIPNIDMTADEWENEKAAVARGWTRDELYDRGRTR
jgi:predicted HTH domain antitoxin